MSLSFCATGCMPAITFAAERMPSSILTEKMQLCIGTARNRLYHTIINRLFPVRYSTKYRQLQEQRRRPVNRKRWSAPYICRNTLLHHSAIICFADTAAALCIFTIVSMSATIMPCIFVSSRKKNLKNACSYAPIRLNEILPTVKQALSERTQACT